MIAMAMYLIMTVFFSRLLRWMEGKMDGSDSFDMATTDTLAHTSGMLSYRGKRKQRSASVMVIRVINMGWYMSSKYCGRLTDGSDNSRSESFGKEVRDNVVCGTSIYLFAPEM